MEMDQAPRNIAAGQMTLGKVLISIGIGFVILCVLAAYPVLAPVATLNLWEMHGIDILLVVIITFFIFRLSVVTFRLGIGQKFNTSNPLAWYSAKRPIFIIETVVYTF